MAKSSHTITLTFPPGGEVNIDVDGVKGKACLDITKSIQEALGGDITSQKKKGDFFKEDSLKEKVKTGA